MSPWNTFTGLLAFDMLCGVLRRLPRPAPVVLAVVGIVLLAMLSAGNESAVDVGKGLVIDLGGPPEQEPPERGEQAEEYDLPDAVAAVVLGGLAVLLVVAAGLFLLGLVAIVLALSMIRIRRRRKRAAAGPQVVAEQAESYQTDLATGLLRDAASGALDRLARRTDAEPDDAIIAAWIALERAAERTGLARLEYQTPTEFTTIVLAERRVDDEALQRLRSLYLRARFGTGSSLTEADVTAAESALRELIAGLAVRPREPAGAGPDGGEP